MNWLVKIIQGALIGAGAVLPGVSGGVLAVLFGVYKPLMRFLAHPFKEWKNCLMQLWPILVGVVIGYIGIAKVLAEVLVQILQQEPLPEPQRLSGSNPAYAGQGTRCCHCHIHSRNHYEDNCH